MALFYLLHFSEGNAATRLTRRETQVADAPDKEVQGDKQPEAVKLGLSSRVTVTVVSLAALAVIGAAAGNSLPNHEYFALPKFDGFSLPKLEIALP